jgi:hypothetical protein
MSSSISSSEPLSRPLAWRRALRRYVEACLLLPLAVAALLTALDPYDSGVLGIFDGYGVPQFGPRLTNASIARRAEVQSAIIGNSTSQLLDPARLTGLTGLRFVSLTIPGTGPVEQLAVAHWLVDHHAPAGANPLRALVIGLDASWCGNQPLTPLNPFPFWLYSGSRLRYLANLISLKGLEAMWRKVMLLMRLEPPLRPDGYRDYDTGHHWDAADVAARLAEMPAAALMPEQMEFAAASRLADLLAALPSDATVVLLFVPRHHNALPPPSSDGARLLAACKAAYRDLAAARPHTAVLDWLVDGELARDDKSFWDLLHFRQPVARQLEQSIAAAIRNPAAEARSTSAAGTVPTALLPR